MIDPSMSPAEIVAAPTKAASQFQVNKHKKDAAKQWDLFYKVTTPAVAEISSTADCCYALLAGACEHSVLQRPALDRQGIRGSGRALPAVNR